MATSFEDMLSWLDDRGKRIAAANTPRQKSVYIPLNQDPRTMGTQPKLPPWLTPTKPFASGPYLPYNAGPRPFQANVPPARTPGIPTPGNTQLGYANPPSLPRPGQEGFSGPMRPPPTTGVFQGGKLYTGTNATPMSPYPAARQRQILTEAYATQGGKRIVPVAPGPTLAEMRAQYTPGAVSVTPEANKAYQETLARFVAKNPMSRMPKERPVAPEPEQPFSPDVEQEKIRADVALKEQANRSAIAEKGYQAQKDITGMTLGSQEKIEKEKAASAERMSETAAKELRMRIAAEIKIAGGNQDTQKAIADTQADANKFNPVISALTTNYTAAPTEENLGLLMKQLEITDPQQKAVAANHFVSQAAEKKTFFDRDMERAYAALSVAPPNQKGEALKSWQAKFKTVYGYDFNPQG